MNSPFTAEELEAGRPRSHQPKLLNPSPVPCCAGPGPVGVGISGVLGWERESCLSKQFHPQSLSCCSYEVNGIYSCTHTDPVCTKNGCLLGDPIDCKPRQRVLGLPAPPPVVYVFSQAAGVCRLGSLPVPNG